MRNCWISFIKFKIKEIWIGFFVYVFWRLDQSCLFNIWLNLLILWDWQANIKVRNWFCKLWIKKYLDFCAWACLKFITDIFFFWFLNITSQKFIFFFLFHQRLYRLNLLRSPFVCDVTDFLCSQNRIINFFHYGSSSMLWNWSEF